MISDRLYELAFAYKKTKLWEVLWDSEMFAVELSDGRIGYISIMGAAGSHCSLGLYIGSKGLDSFRTMAKADQFGMEYFEFHEQLIQQDCLQCSFEGKEEMSEAELEEVRAYARGHKIKLAGKNAYPQFTKYQPNLCPWHLQSEEEQDILCEALQAAIVMAGILEGKTPGETGFQEIGDGETEIPMLERKDGSYTLTTTIAPAECLRELPRPQAVNEIGIAKLKKMRKSGTWECGIIRIPEPVRDGRTQGTAEEIPFFPVFLIAVNAATGYILPLPSVKNYEDNPEELLDLFIEGLVKQKVCPGEILVKDQRTYEFARVFCDKLKVRLEMEEELEAFEAAEEALLDRLDMDEEEELKEFLGAVDMLLDMEDGQLEELPAEVVEQFTVLMDHGVFPQEMENKLRQVFDRMGGGSGDTASQKTSDSKIRQLAPPESYVISVSLGSGCYRHIQISGNSTLLELHRAILDAFAFDDDHAHAFFMDNHVWSQRECYYAEEAGEGKRHTGKCRLNQLGLHQGKQFKYVFDFGDEWTFQCKVLRIQEGHVAETAVIRSKGEAPSQYEDWDDDWDDE